jgi:hypothetical protein
LIVPAALLALLAPGCGKERGALAGNGGFVAVMDDVPIGEQWATMNASLLNTSGEALTILKLEVSGPGVGTVVRVLETKIAPIPRDGNSLAVTSGGIWRTLPPVEQRGTRCAAQTLRPVDGFVLQPGRVVRALLLMEAESVGAFSFKGVRVTYEREGEAVTELVDFGQQGSVTAEGMPTPPLAGDELACAQLTRVLPDGSGS